MRRQMVPFLNLESPNNGLRKIRCSIKRGLRINLSLEVLAIVQASDSEDPPPQRL